MDSETSTINDVDLLERVLLDGNAEPMHVPFSLLESITNSFSEDHQIGSGGFAVVYKGIVGKVMVAVKKLSTFSLPEDKFNGEVECLTKARHKNVVRFVGYCSDTQKRIAYVDEKFIMAEVRNWLLCFEYVPNGSLDKHITDASGGLEWRERYGIIKGICEGLLHLHKSGILHLDLKPGNILVDDHMVPKIADFGLSKCLDKEQSRAFLTKIYVSPGYFAPEYSSGEVAFTSDIYSLGVIILEILTGKKGYPEDEKVINNWKNRLEGSDHWDVQLEQVRVCMKIGIECMDLDPKKRPVAHHIIDRLHGKTSNVETSISSSSVEQQVVGNWENRLEGSDHWNTQLEQVRVSMKIGIDCMDLDPKKRPVAHHIIDTIDGKISSIETSIRSSSVEQQLEHVLLDGNAEPMYVPLSLLEEITDFFSDDHEIGRGGLAVVYKGIVGKGMIAVKKLSRPFDLPESKFHKEVECLVKAKHKNIVRFLGYCSETQGGIADYKGMFVMSDRNCLLCFEYVPNGSLDKYITVVSHGLEWRDRFEIIKGICEGLSHLHKMRILHLDLKPSNILIDDRMVPKIADFGLSRCLDKDRTQFLTSNLCGSIGYLAPEFFRGQVSYATDIYSLGCIIVEILTGVKGYPEDENVVGNWENRLEGSDHWDTELEQVRVCMKIGIECMDLDPKKRPVALHIIDRLHGKASSVETSISSSSAEQQVSFLEEQARHIIDRLHAEASSVGTTISSSSVKQQDTKHNVIPEDANLSSTNSGLLYKLNNLDIFNTKARRNYLANGGPLLESTKYVKLFKKVKLKPILNGSNLIGRGSSGEVYVGFVDRVQVVLRKQIGVSGMQEKRKFANEVIIQSQILHKNIVRFIGCCVEVEIPMLVYEFFSKGSLDEILCGHNRVPLDLAMRLSIAAQAAGALAYMHSKTFLHGNVRSSNILLNDLFVPKISDSGISRMFDEYYHQEITLMSSDTAYMDPVYLQTGLLTEKSDVYGFGIVILELLTRKRATHSDNNSLKNFLENHKKGRISTTLFDKEIAVTGDLEILDNLAEVVVECLALDVDQRPTMKVVAKRLSILNKSHELALLQAS